jgi:hypothetical protein
MRTTTTTGYLKEGIMPNVHRVVVGPILNDEREVAGRIAELR